MLIDNVPDVALKLVTFVPVSDKRELMHVFLDSYIKQEDIDTHRELIKDVVLVSIMDRINTYAKPVSLSFALNDPCLKGYNGVKLEPGVKYIDLNNFKCTVKFFEKAFAIAGTGMSFDISSNSKYWKCLSDSYFEVDTTQPIEGVYYIEDENV